MLRIFDEMPKYPKSQSFPSHVLQITKLPTHVLQGEVYSF